MATRRSGTSRTKTTTARSRLSIAATADTHWFVPPIDGRDIPVEILDQISEALGGWDLPRCASSSGAFGTTFYIDRPGVDARQVVKVSFDSVEAGMSEFARRAQASRDARLRGLTRRMLPRIDDVVEVHSERIAKFWDYCSQSPPRKGRKTAIFAVVREDIPFTTRDLEDALNEVYGAKTTRSISEVVYSIMSAVKSVGPRVEAKDSLHGVHVSTDLRAIERARAEGFIARFSLPDDLNAGEFLSVAESARGLYNDVMELYTRYGIGITDLHSGNIRWRYEAPARGWEQAHYPAPVIADYGMSLARCGAALVRRVSSNPPGRGAAKWEIATDQPRVVRTR